MCSVQSIHLAKRPVVVIGAGVRAAGADAARVFKLGYPVLSSWQAADLVDNTHPLYFGRPGVYGQRTANRIFYEADYILSLGCRLSLPMIGHKGIRPDQGLMVVDVDSSVCDPFPQAESVGLNLKQYMADISLTANIPEWIAQCNEWRVPWIESVHNDPDGYISPYRFVDALHPLLKPDQIIVTDMGTALVCAHQILCLKPPQRLMTSGGLGEMGCALPAAIGASFATGKGEVLCLHCDGGMMMNLQELQTIVHHQLPIKIVVFANDGYAMLRGTQNNLGMAYSGVNKNSGLSCPDFRKLAQAMGMMACDVRTWNDFRQAIPTMFAAKEPCLVQVHIDPNQKYLPKLQPIVASDGTITSPHFHQLSPLL